MSLLLAASCLASVPAFAFETTVIGNEEYTTPTMDPSYGPINTAEEEALARRFCPRGWDRVPQYRWNWRRHRWEVVGWTCRRHRASSLHTPNPGGPGDGVWPPGA